MKIGHLGMARPAVQARNAVILFWVGLFRLGIDAGALKEIRSGGRCAPEDLGCAAILSAHELFRVPGGPEGHLLILRPGSVGLRVDRVERMVESRMLFPLPRAFQGAERTWYRGVILEGKSIIPVVNPEMLAHDPISQESVASASDRVTPNPAAEAAIS
jgi:hypothetical protein